MGLGNAVTALPQKVFAYVKPMASKETVPSWFNTLRDRADRVWSQENKGALAQLEARVEASVGLVIAALADVLSQTAKILLSGGASTASMPLRSLTSWQWTQAEFCDFSTTSKNFSALQQSALRVLLAVTGIIRGALGNPEDILNYYKPEKPDPTPTPTTGSSTNKDETPPVQPETKTPPAKADSTPPTPAPSPVLNRIHDDTVMPDLRAPVGVDEPAEAASSSIQEVKEVASSSAEPVKQKKVIIDDGSGVGPFLVASDDDVEYVNPLADLFQDELCQHEAPVLHSVVVVDEDATLEDGSDCELPIGVRAEVSQSKRRHKKRRKAKVAVDTDTKKQATEVAASSVDKKAVEKDAEKPVKDEPVALASSSSKSETHPHALSRETSKPSAGFFSRMRSKGRLQSRKSHYEETLAAELAKEAGERDQKVIDKATEKIAQYTQDIADRETAKQKKLQRKSIHRAESSKNAREDFQAAVDDVNMLMTSADTAFS